MIHCNFRVLNVNAKSNCIPLEKTKSSGAVLLDQLVTIDYNARQWRYVETVDNDFLNELLKTVVVVFQNNN